jgi:hypothetical protein
MAIRPIFNARPSNHSGADWRVTASAKRPTCEGAQAPKHPTPKIPVHKSCTSISFPFIKLHFKIRENY